MRDSNYYDTLYTVVSEGQYDQPARDWKDALSIPDVCECDEAQHILVGDNFNKKINPHHDSRTSTKVFAVFSLFCCKNRIPTNHLDDTQWRGDIANLPVSAFLPTLADCSVLHSNFTILVSRIIVKHVPYFSTVVPMNIQHQYSKEMEKASKVVHMFCSQL